MQPKIYFQPYYAKVDDETHQISWEFPFDLLFSFQAFATEKDALDFMEKKGYSISEVNVVRYQDNDIEKVTILDSDGNVVHISEMP